MQQTPQTTIGKDAQILSIPLWMVWIIAFFFVGIGLGSYAILDNNEGLYSEIAREMLHSGDWHHWIIPHLNGLVYMEKPPLLYWLTALFFSVFGESETVARLVPACSALGCVGLILCFGRRLGRPHTARLAAIMFVSGLGVTAMSRTLMFDMLLTCLLTAALMSAYFFMMQNQMRALCLAYAFLALAVMAKGFVAIILFCAVMGSFVLIQSRSITGFFTHLTRFLSWKAIAIFLAIVLPWHIVASATEPIFAWFYFINEHVLRFLGRREPHDYYAGAWWYYLPRMVLYLFPWSFLLIGVLLGRRKSAQKERTGQSTDAYQPSNPVSENQLSGCSPSSLLWFLSLAWLMPMLFFSISSAKANYYLVAVMPLASVQLAILLEDRDYGGRWGRLLPGILLAIVFAVMSWFLFHRPLPKLESVAILGLSGDAFLRCAVAGLVVLSVIAGIVASRRPRIGILVYLLLPIATLFVFLNVLHVSTDWTSTRTLADAIKTDYPTRKLFLFQIFEDQSSLAFYMKKPIYIIESRSSDLFWGIKLHKNNNIGVNSFEFEVATATTPAAVIVLNRDVALFESKTYAKKFRLAKQFATVSLFVN